MSAFKEYGKRRGLCFKYRECRLFYRMIHGKWLRLCRDCWDKNAK